MSEVKKGMSRDHLSSSDNVLHNAWTATASAVRPSASWTGGGHGLDASELHRLREANLLLSEECSAVKEVLSTANLASSGECSRLREQVSTLFRENCSLKEHSAKLAIESKALKKQLTACNTENAALRHRLAQFSQQLKSVAKTNASPAAADSDQRWSNEDSTTTSSISSQLPLVEQGSLEQISHQLLVHLQREKLELEQQYTQMVEIQNLPSNSTGGSVDDGIENANTTTALLNHLDACLSSGRLLKREAALQNRLLSALVDQLALTDTLQKVAEQRLAEPRRPSNDESGKSPQNDVQIRLRERSSKSPDNSSSRTSLEVLLEMYDNEDALLSEKSTVYDEEATTEDMEKEAERVHTLVAEAGCANDQADNRVCPMCTAVFPISVPLLEFEAHVMEHFRGEDFEIIMHDPAVEDDDEGDVCPLGGGFR